MQQLLMVLILFQFTPTGYSLPSYNVDAKYGTDLLCSQLSQFLPSFCKYPVVNRTCQKICSRDGDRGRLHCGIRQVPKKPRRVRRIVGGNYSVPGEWPWRVGLLFNGEHKCGGSLLSEYFVLTAWHCFDPDETSRNAADWKVVSGENTLLLGDDNIQVVGVRKLILHSEGKMTKYYMLLKDKFAVGEEDIAILALDQPIKFDGVHRSSICLPDINQRIANNQMAYVSGWGHTVFKGDVSDQLRHALVPIVSTKTCNSEVAYNNTIPDKKVLCAGYKDGEIDACYYDSGGSLDYKVKDRWYSIGIVSSGWECARPNAYGLYTRVTNYMDWIIDAILFKTDAK